MATFYPSKRYGGYATIIGKVKSVEVKDGFDGVVRLLGEHGIIQESVVA